jgi:hypothetical protein
MGLMCDGGLGVCAVWVCFGAVRATALAHAVVCRRRYLYNNQISSIANESFARLTALTWLYGAGLWAWAAFVSCCLVLAWMWGLLNLYASFYNGIITSSLPFLVFLVCICLHAIYSWGHGFILFLVFFVYVVCGVCMYVFV